MTENFVIFCTKCHLACEHTNHHMSMHSAWKSVCCGEAVGFREKNEWHKRPMPVALQNFWQVWEGERPVADFITTEEEADRIIADHATMERLRGCEHSWELLTPFGQTGAEWCSQCGARKQYSRIYLPALLADEAPVERNFTGVGELERTGYSETEP